MLQRLDFLQHEVPRLIPFGVLLLILAGCGPLDTPEPTPEQTPAPSPAAIQTATPEPTATAIPTPTITPVPEPTVTPTPVPETVDYTFEIVNTFPHDRRAFTQGLEFRDGHLYESTGLYGESTLRQVDLESGQVIQQRQLDDSLFGEGLTIHDGKIYQLTWRAGSGLVYDRTTFSQIDEFSYSGEGWGLANDGNQLIMSDGSDTLFFRDFETFDVVETVSVHDDNGPVHMLNELEYIDGEVWANIWMDDLIVVIDPETGWVNRRIDLTGLLQDEDRGIHRVDVLNGIAWDAGNERLFVTGKLWPVLYEIIVLPSG